MGDRKPKTHTQIVRATGLYEPAVWIVLNHYGKKGFILHKDKSILKYERFFKGKAGFRGNPSKTFQAI